MFCKIPQFKKHKKNLFIGDIEDEKIYGYFISDY